MAKGKKTGGRKKGTPNKLTKEVKELLREIVTDEINNIPCLLETLEPLDRLKVLTKLIPFVVPKASVKNRQNSLEEIMQDKDVSIKIDDAHAPDVKYDVLREM